MGFWEEIVLDDFFPCFPLSDPIFVGNENEEYWAMLIEKAFAKLHGSYAALNTGNVREGLIDLTNCPTFEIQLNSEDTLKKIKNDVFWKEVENWIN